MAIDRHGLLRLASWMSPAFPVGGYSYSHGIEYAVEIGLVGDRSSLVRWVGDILRFGSGWNDGILFAAAWRAASTGQAGRGSAAVLRNVAELAASLRPTRELAEETLVQGNAFLQTVRAAWPHPALDIQAAVLADAGIEPAFPIAVAMATAVHGVGLGEAVVLYLHAFAANLVSAAVRLVPLGQTDGQRAIAALEPAVLAAAGSAVQSDLDSLGSAAAMVDWTSMSHETQYTRLFRS